MTLFVVLSLLWLILFIGAGWKCVKYIKYRQWDDAWLYGISTLSLLTFPAMVLSVQGY
jgi:hypothetical protein